MFGRGWLPDAGIQAVICLVHGLGEYSGRYANLAAALVQAGFALVSFDLRGHGRSQGKRGHTSAYEALINDITCFLDETEKRFPHQRCYLYGHSLGGNLVLYYALRHQRQLAGVVATAPWLALPLEPPAWKVTLAQVLNKLWPSLPMNNGLDNRAMSSDPEVVRRLDEDRLYHHRISPRMFVGVRQAARWILRHAAEFRLPLLLMHGGADSVTSAEASRKFADLVPGDCTFQLWPGFYHEIHNEPQQAEVFEYIAAWLRSHPRPE